MYDFLLKYLPPRWANIGMIFWYTLLILMILYLFRVEGADFRYVDY